MSEFTNIYQKISAVMQDVSYLRKDDHVKFGTTDYKAISEEKVTSTIRESLIKNKLVIFPVEQEHAREGTLSTVNTKYKIVDIESGQSEIIVSSGTGVDTQDKGVGKAMTYSYKYLLLRTFAIPTGEDPDKTSNEEIESKQNKKQEQKQQSKKISTNQLKMLNALISRMDKEKGISRERTIETLRKKDGVGQFDSVADLEIGPASKAIETLQNALGDK